MSHATRDSRVQGRLDFHRLAQLFHSWPNSREYHISECDKVRVYYFSNSSVLFRISVIYLCLHLSVQIYLPYDILGIFILFVFDQKKKFVYVLDPLPRPIWGDAWKLARRLTLPFNWQTPNGMTTSPNGDAKSLLFRQTCTGKNLF